MPHDGWLSRFDDGNQYDPRDSDPVKLSTTPWVINRDLTRELAKAFDDQAGTLFSDDKPGAPRKRRPRSGRRR